MLHEIDLKTICDSLFDTIVVNQYEKDSNVAKISFHIRKKFECYLQAEGLLVSIADPSESERISQISIEQPQYKITIDTKHLRFVIDNLCLNGVITLTDVSSIFPAEKYAHQLTLGILSSEPNETQTTPTNTLQRMAQINPHILV